MKRVALTLPGLLIIGGLVGCCCFGLPDRNLKRTVADSEVAGTWRLTNESLRLLTRDGVSVDPESTYSIQLSPDGTLNFHSVIDDSESGTRHAATGQWVLQHNTTGNSNVEKANVLVMEIERGDTVRRRVFNFDEKQGRLILWDFYGDPDSWEFMEYERLDDL